MHFERVSKKDMQKFEEWLQKLQEQVLSQQFSKQDCSEYKVDKEKQSKILMNLQ